MLPCKMIKLTFLVVFFLFIKNNESKRIHDTEAELVEKMGINPAELKTDTNHHPKIPKYIRKLYKAMNELKYDPQSNEDISKMKITMYRPSGTIQQDKSISYTLNKADFLEKDLTKAELVFQNKKHGPSVEVKVSCSIHGQSKQIESGNTEDGMVADVTSCVKSENLERSVKFWVFATHLRTNHSVSLRQIRRMHPILVTFQNDDMRVFSEILYRAKRDVVNDVVNEVINDRSFDFRESLDLCRLKPWTINFTALGLNWVRLPSRYNANICTGRCPDYFIGTHLNSTTYNSLRSLYRRRRTDSHDTNEIPGACCVPVSYAPYPLLYIHGDGEQLSLKNFPDMKVLSCGCR